MLSQLSRWYAVSIDRVDSYVLFTSGNQACTFPRQYATPSPHMQDSYRVDHPHRMLSFCSPVLGFSGGSGFLS